MNLAALSRRPLGAALVLVALGSLPTSQQLVTAQQVWRLEAEVGDSILFDEVTDLAVDSRGNLYVLDGRRPLITVIDSTGKIVRRMGRKGAGPAELMAPNGLAVAADGSVWVQDRGAGRVIVFAPDGTHRDAFPFLPRSISTPWPAVMLESGGLADHTRDPRTVGNEYGWIARKHPVNHILVSRDSVALGDDPPRKFIGTNTRSVIPFAPGLQYGIAPQGFIWVANTAEYKVRKLGFDGTVLATVEKPSSRVRIPEEQRARVVKGVSDFLKEPVPMDEIPTVYPALSSLSAGLDGSLWVSLSTASTTATTTYERYSASGRGLPSIVMPRASYPGPVFTATNIYAVMRSADDVPSIVRFRIP